MLVINRAHIIPDEYLILEFHLTIPLIKAGGNTNEAPFFSDVQVWGGYIYKYQKPKIYFLWRTQHENIPNAHVSAYCR